MFVIIGALVVLGSVIGGYLLSHGKMLILFQPFELLIILGAAIGTLLIANPLSVVIGVVKGMIGTLKGSPYSKAFYLEQLKMLNDVFFYARKNGLVKLEADVEEPDKSPLFANYKTLLSNHHALYFICDTLRMAISGGVGHFEIDQMMELDMEVHHHEAEEPVHALNTMSDALPGLGIVAAVLGIVITMNSLGGPVEDVGHHVAAALVGTFLGILMCYGFFGPLAANMAKLTLAEKEYYNFLRIGLVSFIKGSAPSLAAEFARRSIPAHYRPSFKEMEQAVKGGGA
jgi:chemotaxis protein MotA